VSDATSKATKSSAAPKAVKKEASESPKKGKTKAEKEEEEEIFKWWEQNQDPNGDGSSKWTTLEHNGVYFPPPYETLPSNVKMLYKGAFRSVPAIVQTNVMCQDIPLTFHPNLKRSLASMQRCSRPTMQRTRPSTRTFSRTGRRFLPSTLLFVIAILYVLSSLRITQRNGTKIVDFEACDFRPMFEHFEAEKAKRKAMTTEEKKAAKKAKEELESKYTHCILDGRKEKVGNFRVEPPGLFRGRGDHPKKGALKVSAEQLNWATVDVEW